jgi:predicted nucleic-acid-binding Zn-ribbon protein
MLNGICPKCGSHEVYTDANMPNRAAYIRGVQMLITQTRLFMPGKAILDDYVCVRCGYHESYLQDSNKLQEIVENWSIVQVQER